MELQPTAFHQDIEGCTQCHKEHLGKDGSIRTMPHETLTDILLERLEDKKDDLATQGELASLHYWLNENDIFGDVEVQNPFISPKAALLSCSKCHSNIDPHDGFFGRDLCANCHTTKLLLQHIISFKKEINSHIHRKQFKLKTMIFSTKTCQ